MKAILALLPPWVAPAAIGLLLATLVGGYFVWRAQERAIGAERVIAADQKALAEQSKKDAALNQQLAVKLQVKVTQLESVAIAAGRKIALDPVAPGGQAEIDAAAAVRCMLDASLCAR